MAVIPFRKPRRSWRCWFNRSGLIFAFCTLAASAVLFAVIFFWDDIWRGDAGGAGGAGGTGGTSSAGSSASADRLSINFRSCFNGQPDNCVIDGDTFWLRGQKIRIADINTPELGYADCDYERRLATKAKRRLLILLNDGPFSLQKIARNRDKYGRKLRIVTRNGESIGDQMVAEGLAEYWQGYRRNWCG